MKRHLLVMLLILVMGSMLISTPVFAGWTQAKGHAYNQLTYSQYVTDHKMSTVGADGRVDEANTKYEASDFKSHSVTYYTEYGIIDTLTMFLGVPYKWTNSDDVNRFANDENSPHGIGDINTGLRYRLSPNLLGFVVSVQGDVKIPEAYKYGDPMDHLSLGDGQYDYTGALLLGRGLGKGYAHLMLAYKYRDFNKQINLDNGWKPVFKPSDQLKFVLGGGYTITPWFAIRALVDYAKSVGNAEVNDDQVKWALEKGQVKTSSLFDLEHPSDTLVRDTLSLEGSTLNVSGALVFSHKKMQFVLSYGADLPGLEGLEINSRNSGLGEAYSVALVYLY